MVTMQSVGLRLVCWGALVSTVVASSVVASSTEGQVLSPRVPLDPGPVRAAIMPPELQTELALSHRLVIKFVDQALARADADGALVGATGLSLANARSLAATHGLSFSPLITLPQATLTSLQERAEARSQRAQPDLAGMLIVHVPDADTAWLEFVGQALADLPEVEFATIQTLGCRPPGDISPVTPNLVGSQLYGGPNPGIGASAMTVLGLTGLGVRLSDCEYGWNQAHEDLNDKNLHLEPGQTIDPQVFVLGWDSHGTAVIGETSAVPNAYGLTGLAPNAEVYTYPEWTLQEGFRRVTSVANAIAGSAPGDVVLLEMQTMGVAGFGPAELDPSLFAVVRTGVDAGVVVVGAAGNGGENLDSPAYASFMGMGDSGSILVGAGSPDLNHNALSFSTFGARVNLQGWGQNVFTLGYGDFAEFGFDKNQRYTSGFNGTSSASPMVAAACVLLQERSRNIHGSPLDPGTLRQILIATGIEQGSGGHIGPLPSVGAAVQALQGINLDPWVELGSGLAGVSGVPLLTTSGTLLPETNYAFGVSNARPISPIFWVMGVSAINGSFKGGILVPSPDLIIGPFTTSFGGLLSVTGTFPPGVLPGFSFFSQFWIKDSAAFAGFSSTVGVQGTTQ
ncbi:MAG: hypothetical protein ACI9EF_000619 [Pseudohongiellaceae bacterium]|jgi:hypothetical protein